MVHMSTDNFILSNIYNMLERMDNNMKTTLLILVLSVLAAGYHVATKATDAVNNIKTNQSMQLMAIGR